MKKTSQLHILDKFLSSEQWDSLCDQAIKLNCPYATELMNNVSIRLDTVYFFTENKNQHRAEDEFNQLTKLIEYLYTIL